MKVAVLGYGVEGKSALRYWSDLGHQVTVCERDTEVDLPNDVAAKTGANYLAGLSEFDLIVRSPGIKPRDIFEATPSLDQAKITSPINVFLVECPAKVIGVTGTKGKGTTSSLIVAILKQAGHTVHLGGNIGTPALDLLPQVQPEDWVVLELSSFQLIDIKQSPHVAVMLMIAPDHLEWHADMHEYVEAKQNIFNFQEPGDRAIYNACNVYSLQSGLSAPGDQIAYNAAEGAWCDGVQVKMGETVICNSSDIALPGRHNWDNVCAAIAATWPIVEAAAPIKQAIQSFTGLPHRLEKVAEVNGVTYIDDSYSSNTGPTLAALQAFRQPKILILGGFDKHLSYDGLAQQIKELNVRQVIVIGAIAPQIVSALDKADFKDYILGAADMTQIVAAAARTAEMGDVVLLSPATSSFDMFKNFKERGEHFATAVNALKDE